MSYVPIIIPKKQKAEYVTANAVLPALLEREDLADQTLEGTDGRTVSCNRIILAVRSSVFNRMFFGDFTESGKSVIKLAYTSQVLYTLIHYCYTDRIEFRDERWADKMNAIPALLDAGEYFDLKGLRPKLEEEVSEWLQRFPGVSLYLLEQIKSLGEVASGILERCLEAVRTNARSILFGAELPHADPSVIEFVVTDEEIVASEIVVFECLKKWAESGKDVPPQPGAPPTKTRREFALELTQHIDLLKISPSDIASIVAPSGLFTPDQLFEAYKAHAVMSENRSPTSTEKMPYQKPRFLPEAVWMRSQSKRYGAGSRNVGHTFLQCPLMRNGIYQWSVKIVSGANTVLLGIGAVIQDVYGNSKKEIVIGITGDGHCHKRGEQVGPARGEWTFVKGSVITFFLDLTQSSPGILAASVDGGPRASLSTNPHKLIKVPIVGLLPCVSLGREKSVVEFVGFEQPQLPYKEEDHSWV